MTEAAQLRKNVYVITLLFSLQFGLLLFFNSSFLAEHGFTEQAIGLIFAAGYAIAILFLFALPALLPRFGDRALFSAGLLVCGLLFFALAEGKEQATIAVLLPLALGLSMSVGTLLDIFLQTASANPDKVGGRRGLMTVLAHIGFIAAQLAAVFLLAGRSFSILYTVTALMLIPLAFISYALFRKFRDTAYEKPDWRAVFARLSASKDLRHVFAIQFLLRLFFAIMVVYTPIYLHEHIGLSLSEMGIIFAVMLVPFLFVGIVGKIEDERLGEQELLIAGFAIIAIATIGLAFITSTSIVVWAAALFLTRIGAALLDVSSEAYFFKHVRGGDAGEVSAYRILYPLAYIAGPLIAAWLLFFLPLQFLFVALGAVMLLGLFPALALRDTR